MATPTLAERITQSFYAWEVRGRGWMTADYPVLLEPPFRPLLLLPSDDVPERIDDGKRHTILSRLVAWLSGERDRVAAVPEPFDEQPPFEALDHGPLVTLALAIPPDFTASRGVMVELLSALATAQAPVSFEIVGRAGTVSIQITVAEDDAQHVISYLESFAPEVVITPHDDLLALSHRRGATVRAIDFGLSDEFFVPLRTDLSVDSYVSLIPALASAGAGEFLTLQVVFTRTVNPWAKAIHEALDDGDGGCIMDDAPWFLRAAGMKTRASLVSAVVRVGAQAHTEERALALIRGVHAFVSQVRDPGGNELVALEDSGADAWTMLRDRQSVRTGMILSTAELAVLANLPDASVRSPALVRSRRKTAPIPRVAQGHAYVLGENLHRCVHTPVSIDVESRFAHTWVLGGSGTGKSTLLANLVLHDLEAGHGLAVFDVHGDLIDDILARVPARRRDDVILFDPGDTEYPIGFNILRANSELEATVLGADLVSIFRRLSTSWGDTMTTVLSEAILAMLHHPEGGTLVHLRRFLVEDAFRASWLASIPDPDVRYFFEHEYKVIGSRSLGPLLTRLDAFLRMRVMRNIVGVRKPALDLGSVMNSGKVFLARLPKGEIGEANAVLLGSLLLAKLTEQALMRQALPREDRLPFFVYVDEAQHFAVPSVESLATEGRKYRVGLVLAHQGRAQLSATPSLESALLANCHTRIVFRVGDEDARYLGKGFLHFEEDDLKALGRGEALVRVGSRDADCNVRTRPLAKVDESVARALRESIRDATRGQYASKVEAIELPAPSPVSTVPVVPPEIAPVPVPASPTPAPHEPIKMPATPGRGGQMHKYLQHLVKRLAEERGFRATIEGIAGPGQVDVRLERDDLLVGVEVSVTTDYEHELANVRKCIDAGFSKVIVVSSEKKVRTKLIDAMRDDAIQIVTVIGPEDIVDVLDALDIPSPPKQSVVRGYKVKVSRQNLSSTDAVGRRGAVAAVLAKAMGR